MDPQACLESIIDALEVSDYGSARQSIADLCNWMKKGGFAPKVDSPSLQFILGTLHDQLRRYED